MVDPYAIIFENTFVTVNEVRKVNPVFFDMVVAVAILSLVTLCLQLLYMKGYIQNYHITDLPT